MKKLLLPIVIFLTAFSLFQVASAQVSGSLWKLGSNNLIPVNSSWGLKIPYFGTNGTLCLQTDNNGLIGTSSAACGSGGGGGDPFTHTSVYGQTTSATSTLLSLTGSLFSLVASSTVEFVNASTTALTVSGTGFFGDGSASAPSIAFASAPTYGLFFNSNNLFDDSIHSRSPWPYSPIADRISGADAANIP